MTKNIPVLKYTTLDFVPNFETNMNAYTWSVVKDLLKIKEWKEVAQIVEYVMDPCPDYPTIVPFSEPIEFEADFDPFRIYIGEVWGLRCALVDHKCENGTFGRQIFVKTKDLGLCT